MIENEEKQIGSCEECLHYWACRINSEYVPTPCRAFEDNAGYRKQSEVAREIFAEIETLLNINRVYSDSGIYYEMDIAHDIADLKKKYTDAAEPQGGEKA